MSKKYNCDLHGSNGFELDFKNISKNSKVMYRNFKVRIQKSSIFLVILRLDSGKLILKNLNLRLGLTNLPKILQF